MMKNKAIIYSLFFLFISSSIALSEETKEFPIARVFDRNIYAADVEPQKELALRYRTQLGEEQFSKWEAEHKKQTLEALIFTALRDHFLTEMKMSATEEEIQAFIDFSVEKDKTQMAEFQTQHDEIVTQLQADDLDEKQRQSLSNHLQQIDQLITFENRRQKQERSIPNFEEVKQESLERIGAITVTNWKFNKALYEKYGGRVIFQQAGLEPIDAYKTFLDEHTQAKSFDVMDPQYGPLFESIVQYFEMNHNYLDDTDAKKYFLKPWWDPAFEMKEDL